jgi:hypothetical protein
VSKEDHVERIANDGLGTGDIRGEKGCFDAFRERKVFEIPTAEDGRFVIECAETV